MARLAVCTDRAKQVLTITNVRHLQVLVRAKAGVSKHRVAGADSTAIFPVTPVNVEWHD